MRTSNTPPQNTPTAKCTKCNGTEKIEINCTNNCIIGWITKSEICSICDGRPFTKGQDKCNDCGALPNNNCSYCKGNEANCNNCKNSGFESNRIKCKKCNNGKEIITCPKC